MCSIVEDYNLFKGEVIDTQGLCVNVTWCEDLEDFTPPVPLQEAEADFHVVVCVFECCYKYRYNDTILLLHALFALRRISIDSNISPLLSC